MSSIGNISPSALGCGSIAAGSALVWKSRTIQSCWNWFQKEQPTTGQKINRLQQRRVKPVSQEKQSTNLSMAVLGVAMIAGGALSLMYGGGSTPSSSIPQLPSASYLSDKDLPCEMRLIAADHNLKSCSRSKELLDRVNAQGGVHIQCVPRQLAWNGARFFPHNRTIFIADDNSDHTHMPMSVRNQPDYVPDRLRATSLLLFEMRNADQEPTFQRILNGACYGTVDRDQYKYHMESIEYESGRTHHEISKACVEETGWNPIIADRFDEAKHKTRNFTPEQTQEWLATSAVGQMIQPEDTAEKVNYIMRNDYSGHSDVVGQMYDSIQRQCSSR